MAEKFTINEVTGNDFVGVMLIDAISKMDLNHGSPYIVDEVCKSKSLEVELRIGGHEYSMREFLKRLEAAFEHSVTKKALEISEERCGNILNRVTEFDRMVGRLIRKEFPEMDEDEY